MIDKAHADYMLSLGRAHGFILGMKRAIEILRAHGVDVIDPSRVQLFNELMESNREGVTAYMEGALNASPPRPRAA